jgi:hypothetical protein
MGAKTGKIFNLGKVSRYMKSRNWLGLVWGLMTHDAKNGGNRRMAVLLLRGEPRNEYQFGVDWYIKTEIGFQNASGDCVPITFVRTSSESGLVWFPNLVKKFYGDCRETLENYLPSYRPSYGSFFERIRVLPNRRPDERGLARVLPREVSSVGRLAARYPLDNLSFNDEEELNQYLTENIRSFGRVRGTARLNNGVKRIDHWKIGPIRA